MKNISKDPALKKCSDKITMIYSHGQNNKDSQISLRLYSPLERMMTMKKKSRDTGARIISKIESKNPWQASERFGPYREQYWLIAGSICWS